MFALGSCNGAKCNLAVQRKETLGGEGVLLEGRFSSNPHTSEIADIGRSLTAANEELKLLDDRWLELSTLLCH